MAQKALALIPARHGQARAVCHVPCLAKEMHALTMATGGLEGLGPDLAFQSTEFDPAVVSSYPRQARLISGGRCPVHQDYCPTGKYKAAKTVSFYLLLQRTTKLSGATFVYPASREVRKRDEPKPRLKEERGPGRPPRRTKLVLSHLVAELNPHALEDGLKRRCGEPVYLAGEKLTLFRHESSEWHGALPNAGKRPRHVLMWSYGTKGMAKLFRKEVTT